MLTYNTLVEEANRRAFTVAEQIQTGKEVSLADFSKNAVAGSNFSSAVTQDTLHHQFALQINNVAPSVCKNILNIYYIMEDVVIQKLLLKEQ